MREADMPPVRGPIVEEEVLFTLVELCQACDAEEELMVAWVREGVFEPSGESPPDWRFSGACLRRARMARRLARDLDINPPGVALVLELLDEISSLRARRPSR